MTIVELMVGVVVGFIAVMAVTLFFVNQMGSNRDMLNVTRLNQELRAIMDLTLRDIRRAGYWGNAISGVYYEGIPGGTVTANPGSSITIGGTLNPSVATNGTSIQYTYDVNGDGAIADDENFKIWLNNGAVELVQGINAPTTTVLSDTSTTTITGLTFRTTSFDSGDEGTEAAPTTVTVSCIVAGSNPTLTIREIAISVTGQLTRDTSVTRTMQETVRIRADRIAGSCPAVT